MPDWSGGGADSGDGTTAPEAPADATDVAAEDATAAAGEEQAEPTEAD